MTLRSWITANGGPIGVGKRFGLTPHAVRKWLRRQSTPRPKVIQKIVQLSSGNVSYKTILTETYSAPKKAAKKVSKKH